MLSAHLQSPRATAIIDDGTYSYIVLTVSTDGTELLIGDPHVPSGRIRAVNATTFLGESFRNMVICE